MSQVYKCDRCGTTLEYCHHRFSGSVAMGGLKSGWYPKEIELCEACGMELNDLMKKWWNYEQTEQK